MNCQNTHVSDVAHSVYVKFDVVIIDNLFEYKFIKIFEN